MTHTALLIPADPAAPHRTLTWDGDGLLPVLYRELGDELTAATVAPAGPVPGGLRLWGQDRALLVADPDYNDRAIAICRHFGYQVPALAGPIVFLGAVDGDEEAGLAPAMLALLDDGLQRMRELIDEIPEDAR
jgi:hypothetical protein